MPRYYDPFRMHGGACGLQHSKRVVYLCSIRRNVRLNRRPAPKLMEAITGPISGSASACRPTLVIAISIQIAKQRCSPASANPSWYLSDLCGSESRCCHPLPSLILSEVS
jgi:hypothetical protein